MSKIDSYYPSQGGLGGVWNQGTSAVGNLLHTAGGFGDKATGWMDILIYGGIAIVGVFVLLLGVSFASGRQNLGQVAGAVTTAARRGM